MYSPNGVAHTNRLPATETAPSTAANLGKTVGTALVQAAASRKLRLLRAHGVIQKIPKTHRYQLTTAGQLLTAALSAERNATLKQLIGAAA